jgi:hypothetical protein
MPWARRRRGQDEKRGLGTQAKCVARGEHLPFPPTHPPSSSHLPSFFFPLPPTRSFVDIHSAGATRQLDEFLVGKLPDEEGTRKETGSGGGGSALSYLIPVVVLGVAVWWQFLGGSEMFASKA